MKIDWPSVVAGAVISGVIGLATTFYFSSRNELAYSIHRQVILDRDAARSVTVLDSNNQPVLGNIHSFEVKIWNSGNVDIPHQSVRRPLGLACANISRILQATPLGWTTPEISPFKISIKNGNSIDISWEYFDPKTGLAISVLTDGEITSSCEMVGSMFPATIKRYDEKLTLGGIFGFFVIIFLGISFIYQLLCSTLEFIYYKFNHPEILKLLGNKVGKIQSAATYIRSKESYIMLFGFLAAAIFSLYILIFVRISPPPI